MLRGVIDPVDQLLSAVVAAASALRGGAQAPAPTLERPPKAEFGDYSTNMAMLLAPAMGEPPRAIAERLSEELGQSLGDDLDRAEVAGPGFLNLFMSDGWCCRSLAGILAAGDAYGSGERSGRRISVEFVSANPTGPVTVASGRHAAYGDSLCRTLEFAGNEVDREYYVNDRGGQIDRFAASIRARARGEDPPEGGYMGAYVSDVAHEIGPDASELDDRELGDRGVEIRLRWIRETLERFRVHMDRFSSELALHESG